MTNYERAPSLNTPAWTHSTSITPPPRGSTVSSSKGGAARTGNTYAGSRRVGLYGGRPSPAGASSHNARRTTALWKRFRLSASPYWKPSGTSSVKGSNLWSGKRRVRKYSWQIRPRASADSWLRTTATSPARTGSPVQRQHNLHRSYRLRHNKETRSSHNHPREVLDGGTPSQDNSVNCPHQSWLTSGMGYNARLRPTRKVQYISRAYLLDTFYP